MRPSDTPLISELEIQLRVRQLAAEINADYAGREVLALVVLKGAAFFAADLLKHLHCGVSVEFIRARSYEGAVSGGNIDFIYWPDCGFGGRDVLIVEDILDTGQTCAAIVEKIKRETPASVEICVLLDKPENRKTNVAARYAGFTIGNQFVVGYGMDYCEKYRNLNSVHVMG